MVLMKELAFQPCHVHARWALRFAGFALKTQIENREKGRVSDPSGTQVSRDRQPKRVGPSPSGIGFVQGGHVRRAHGSRHGLSASPYSTALLHGTCEAFEIGKIEERLQGVGGVLGAVLEVLGDGGGADDLTRVEHPVFVEGLFHPAKGLVKGPPEHLLLEG